MCNDTGLTLHSSGGIMAHRRKLIKEDYSDVINSYAVFMGYQSMAIKGLGFLILTWTTVVLLGGFVSALQNKDFWCLTFITLVQTAGIFDVYLNEKLSYIVYSANGFMVGSVSGFLSNNVFKKGGIVARFVRTFLALVSLVIQMMVLAILLCPLAAIYIFGLLISTCISLWRLIQHDYAGNLGEQENLKPAMDTLYCLSLLQGLLFFYRFTFARVGKRIAKDATHICGDGELEAVLTYLCETRIGCEKNPSFARGRSFITHALDLIGSKSPDDCLSGVQLLYTAICMRVRRLKDARLYGKKKSRHRQWEEIIGQHMLTKNMIMSASSSPILQKVLLQTLNPRGVYDIEMRKQAARIVAYLALDIHLEQFPRGIEYISNLIGTFEEYRLTEPYHRARLIHKYKQDYDRQVIRQPSAAGNDEDGLREAYEKLVLRGLCILRKLAIDKTNCRIISETQGLLPRIMAPLTSDLIHQFNGGAWSISVVDGSMKVMRLLVTAPGEIGARMRQEISNNKEAVSTMERILNCDYCHVKLQKQAMGILIQLYIDTKSRTTFIKMLVDIFVAGDSRDRSIRELAGEALAKLSCQNGSNTSIILQVDGDAIGRLTKILLDAETKTCRIRAAEILEHMCNIHHTEDDEFTSELKTAMTSTMPKVLTEILCCKLAKDETHARKEADYFDVLEQDDIENQFHDQPDHAPHRYSSSTEGDRLEFLENIDLGFKYKKDKTSSATHLEYKEDKTSYSNHPEYKEEEEENDMDMEEDESENEENEEFRAPLLSLCVTVCDTFMSADQDLACEFDTINLAKKLKEMVEKNIVPTVHCLRLMKLTCKMVISMMKHSSRYIKEDLDSLMNALSIASERMLHLDMSMVFASQGDGGTIMKPVRSFSSLVQEAKESAETRSGS